MYVLYIKDHRFEILLSSDDRSKLEVAMDEKLAESMETKRRLDAYQTTYDVYADHCKSIVREYFTTNIDAIEFPHKSELVCQKTKLALIEQFAKNFRTCFEEPLCLYLNRDKLPPFPAMPKWTQKPPNGFRVLRDNIHITEVQEI